MAKVIKGVQPLDAQLKKAKRDVGMSRLMVAMAAVFMVYQLIRTVNMIFLICFIPISLFLYDMNGKKRTVKTIQAGIEGEKKAVEQMGTMLDDRYTIINCVNVYYDGHKSQVDNIVVGPSGVFVVEIKSINGLITGKADERIWRVKRTANGKEVTRETYSPLKQVQTHAKRTADYLKDEGFDVNVAGLVYYVDERTELQIENEPKNTLFTIEMNPWLKKHLTAREDVLTAKQAEGIIKSLT